MSEESVQEVKEEAVPVVEEIIDFPVAVENLIKAYTVVLDWTKSLVNEDTTADSPLHEIIDHIGKVAVELPIVLEIELDIDGDRLTYIKNMLQAVSGVLSQHIVFIIGAIAADHKHTHMLAVLQATQRDMVPLIDKYNDIVNARSAAMITKEEADTLAKEAEGSVSDESAVVVESTTNEMDEGDLKETVGQEPPYVNDEPVV